MDKKTNKTARTPADAIKNGQSWQSAPRRRCSGKSRNTVTELPHRCSRTATGLPKENTKNTKNSRPPPPPQPQTTHKPPTNYPPHTHKRTNTKTLTNHPQKPQKPHPPTTPKKPLPNRLKT